MDEWTFHHELQQLKQQVAHMASRHSGGHRRFHSKASVASDGFLEQVDDLKQHVAELSQRFDGAAAAASFSPSAPEWAQPYGSGPLRTQNSIKTSMHLTLPSGPLFWRMFTSLRSDVHTVEGRVSDLERTVSDLEDRMDSLEPNRFTPASSIGMPEHLSSPTQPVPTAPNVKAEEDKISLGYYDADWQRRTSAVSHCETVPDPTAQRVPALDVSRLSMQEVSEAFLRNRLCASAATVEMLRKFNEKTETDIGNLNEANASLMREIITLQRQHADHIPEWMPHEDARVHGSEVSPRELDAPIVQECDARSDEPPKNLSEQWRGQEEARSHKTVGQKPEGLLFRDREIARLEELLKDSQESAVRCEQAMQRAEAKSAESVARLQSQEEHYSKMSEESSQKERAIRAYESYVRNTEARCDELREQCTYESKRGKEKTAVLCAADQKIEQMQLLLRETQDSRRDLHEMLDVRDDDIRKLQAFCEQKDAITQSQEQIITRGAKLMEQKDEEIETLTRRLKAAEDDNEHEKWQTARLSRLIEERDCELKAAANKPADAGTPELPLRPSKSTERFEKGSSPSPFVFNSAKRGGRHSWSPVPIRGFRRLPSEEHRASAWKGQQKQTQPIFGQASPIGYSTHSEYSKGDRRYHRVEAARGMPSDERSHHYGDEMIARRGEVSSSTSQQQRPGPAPTTENDRGNLGSLAAQEQPPSNHARAERRRMLPMDRTFWPPLPVPVGGASAANRMSSMADLRSSAAKDERSASHRAERIPKHQSMQELKRRYQAYVETEAESGGEAGGDV